MRLTDGGAPNQGRIEYYFNDTWWTLCSGHFHGDTHNTVCRQLGYNDATEHYRESEFGAGNLSILHTSFYCDYGASSLLNCTQGQWYGECYGGVVGVTCDEMVFAGKLTKKYFLERLKAVFKVNDALLTHVYPRFLSFISSFAVHLIVFLSHGIRFLTF